MDECVTELRPVTPPGRALSGWFALQVGGLQQQHRQRGPVRYRQSAQEQQLHHFRVHLGKQLGGRRVQGRTHWRQCAAWAIRCAIQDSGDVSTHPSLKAGLHVHVRGKHKPRVNWDNASTSARKRSARLCLCLHCLGSHVAYAILCDVICLVRLQGKFGIGHSFPAATFSILCDVICLVRLQGKFDIDHSFPAAGFPGTDERLDSAPGGVRDRRGAVRGGRRGEAGAPDDCLLRGEGQPLDWIYQSFHPPSPPPRPFQGVTCGCM